MIVGVTQLNMAFSQVALYQIDNDYYDYSN